MSGPVGHRLVLPPPVAERLLGLAGVRAPWDGVLAPSGEALAPSGGERRSAAAERAVRRLGPLPGPHPAHPHAQPPPAQPPPAQPGPVHPDLALARLGALGPGPGGRPVLHPRLREALAPARSAVVQVVVDLAVAAGSGDRVPVRLRSWQWAADAAVVAVGTAGRQVEVRWHDRSVWTDHLAELPTAARARDAGRPTRPAGWSAADAQPVHVPADRLLAVCAALDADRPDLVDALVRPAQPRPDPRRLRRLHRCRARLRVLATGPERARCLGWVLLQDGWWELRVLGPDLELAPADPARLGFLVEELLHEVGG